MSQLSPNKGNFTKAHRVAFKDDYEAFKKFFDPRFKVEGEISAAEVWKHIGGTVPKKEAKNEIKKDVDSK